MIENAQDIIAYVQSLYKKYPKATNRFILRKASRELNIDYKILKQMV